MKLKFKRYPGSFQEKNRNRNFLEKEGMKVGERGDSNLRKGHKFINLDDIQINGYYPISYIIEFVDIKQVKFWHIFCIY